MATRHTAVFEPNGVFARMLLPARFMQRCKETRFKQEWKLLPAQYIQLMKEFRGPKYQQGSVSAFPYGVIGGGPSGPIVQLSANGVDMFNDGGAVYGGWKFTSNGTLQKHGPFSSSYTDVNGEWWSDEPDTGVGSNYQAGYTGLTGDNWTLSASAEDTFANISIDLLWRISVSSLFSPTTRSNSATFRVRELGGDILDSAVLTTDVEN